MSADRKKLDEPQRIAGAQIFDEEIEALGVALRAEEPAAAPRIHGVTWVLIRDDYVLLERCEKKARVLGVGEWFVPGGKIEGDETEEQACRREVAEEWGVDLATMQPLPIVEGSRVPPGPRGVFLMRPFLVTLDADEVPSSSSEGTPLRWTPISEALASPVLQVRMMVAAAMESRAAATPRAPAGGAEMIASERKRQTEAEEWTSDRDDYHTRGEMAITAACYAAFSTDAQVLIDGKDAFPYGSCKDKRLRHGRIKQLSIAGALIAAEIDRLLRAEKPNV